MFGDSDKEPSFKDAVKKIVQEEMSGLSQRIARLEGEIESLKKTPSAGVDTGKLSSVEEKVKKDLSEMRQNFSKAISDQEARINENKGLITSIEGRVESAGKNKVKLNKSDQAVRDDLKALEKNVFEQFDQMRKSVEDLGAKLNAKTKDFESMMSLLNKFQDEARALSSQNFITDMGTLKSRLMVIEKAVADLKAREPVVIE